MAARTDPVDVISGNVGSSSWINDLPRGRIARSTLTADSTGTTTTEVICSETVTIPAGRTLHIHATVVVRSNIAGGASARLRRDGTQIQRKNMDTLAPGADQSWALEIEDQPGAGTFTYELVTGVSGTDGNTVTAKANGATGTHGVCALYVDDVGPDYI